MKYEMIFGDEELFDGAPEECFCVAKNVYDHRVFYKVDDDCLFWLEGADWKHMQFMPCTPLAMRRIIKEPAKWTWEDKKAGRLPEVGSKVATIRNFYCTVVGVDEERKNIAIQYENGKLDVVRVHCVSPIESPREKYERERDELLKNLREQCNSLPSLINELYEQLKPFEE